jgi:curved DNA-binding protein CbpA
MTLAEAREILKVGLYATKEEIKKAWRARAMETHPDRGGNIEEFKKVQEAHAKLTDESAATNTIEAEIFESIFAELSINPKFAKKIKDLERMYEEKEEMEKPIRVRKAKYPTNQKKKKP